MTHLWVFGSPSSGMGAIVTLEHAVVPRVSGLAWDVRNWPRDGRQRGAKLSVPLDPPLPEVQSAMDESHILEKMAAEAGKKRPGMKPIKGITE